MDPELLVSVVIPVKNGDVWLREVIPAIFNQELDGEIEVIAIDSGSTDDSMSILMEYPVKIFQIKPEEFNHGLTRNKGASLAKGKFVVMTVQDAKPASTKWLQQLIDSFTDDNIAGVCGQQIVPHHLDKNPVEWYRPVSTPEIRKVSFANPELFRALPGDEQLALCRWDDVNAMYRREILLKLPFRNAEFAEDALWAKDALMAGYSLVYNPFAKVEHYHMEDFQFAYKRNFMLQYHFYVNFGVLPRNRGNLFLFILRTIKLLVKERRFSILEKWKWLKYNYRNWLAVDKSNQVLLKCIAKGGEKELTALYRQVCQAVPQALKAVK